MWYVSSMAIVTSILRRSLTLGSKHVLNAQVSIRAPCCKQWFDCAECHAETQDHQLKKTTEMVFACKKCKKAFRKDMSNYEESDEYCPYCDNHYVRHGLWEPLGHGENGTDHGGYAYPGDRRQDTSGCRWCGGRRCTDRLTVRDAFMRVVLDSISLGYRMLKDERMKIDPRRSLFTLDTSAHRLE